MDHLITFGEYRGQLLSQVPEWYLKMIAKSGWAKLHESEIHNAARELCDQKGIALDDKAEGAKGLQQAKTDLELRLSAIFRRASLEYHPDKNRDRLKEAECAQKAINSIREEIQKAFDDYFNS